MQKKTLIQLLILLLILLISIFFFQIYLKKLNIKNISNNIQNKKDDYDLKKSNIIHNIEYISEDKNGNSYILNSEFGEVDTDNPELILLKKVKASINSKKSLPINISANNALYNNITYDTNFFESVEITFAEHIITSDNFDLIFGVNIATIFNNIIYKNLNTKLQADKIEIDLLTKNLKIFMIDKSEKVKIVNTK